MFISDAFATGGSAAASAGSMNDTAGLTSMIPMLLIFFIFVYFLIIRPQQQKIKSHDTMIKALRRGDKVVTGGGIIATISKIEDNNILVLEIAPEVKIRVMAETISHIMNKTVANDN